MWRECKREGRIIKEENEAEINVMEGKTEAASDQANTNQDLEHRFRKEKHHPISGTLIAVIHKNLDISGEDTGSLFGRDIREE